MSDCGLKIHVEVIILLLFFAFMVSDSVKTNLIIYRTCYVLLGYNTTECSLLGSKNVSNETARLEKIVEPHANVISMTTSIVEACFTAIICFFVGPWSDRFGRKLFLNLPLIGYFLGYTILAACAYIPDISPWYFALSSIPVILTGGLSTYLTVVLCYLSDITTESNRGVRMGTFEAVLSLGIFLGNLSSSYVFTTFGYPIVFLLSALCCFIAAAFTIIFIPESIHVVSTENSFRSLFQLGNVSEMLRISFKRREGYTRGIILCCVAMLTLFIIAINADGAVIFLYLREKLKWSLEKYTLYSAAHNVTWILGTLIGVYILHKMLKMPESILILIGFISMLATALIQGLATKDWHIYVGAGVRCLGAVLSPMVRSLVTKIIPAEEIGKIFSLIVTSESFCGMVGSPLYTTVYNATIQTNPGIFNFVTAGIYVIQIAIIIAVIYMLRTRKENTYLEPLINNDSEESIHTSETE